jgi:hypothetical protein
LFPPPWPLPLFPPFAKESAAKAMAATIIKMKIILRILCIPHVKVKILGL